MTPLSLTILLFGVLCCGGASFLAIRLRRSITSKDKLLAEMQAALRSRQDVPDDGEEPSLVFEEDLRRAALTTRFQEPRLNLQQNSQASATPERYRYIQSMVEMGLDAREIASALSMSLAETTQLITLIKMTSTMRQNSVTSLPSSETRDEDGSRPLTRVEPAEKCTPCRLPVAEKSGPIHKSPKLARWLKARALPSFLRRQSSREPPRAPLPGNAQLPRSPLPGYI